MKILLLSPHTDDVELGAGGTIIKLLEGGNEILWVVFSSAEISLPNYLPKDTLKKEFLSVVNNLGLSNENIMLFDFKVRELHNSRQDILENLIEIRRSFEPEIIIGPSINDFHQDHQIVANEMIRAFKTTSSIISYELPWNHLNFNTQLFIRLKKAHIAKKCEILRKYNSQILYKGKKYFAEEYVFGLAKVRGVQCNSEYAEVFEVIRWMI